MDGEAADAIGIANEDKAFGHGIFRGFVKIR
jgi:hypothetical protein